MASCCMSDLSVLRLVRSMSMTLLLLLISISCGMEAAVANGSDIMGVKAVASGFNVSNAIAFVMRRSLIVSMFCLKAVS